MSNPTGGGDPQDPASTPQSQSDQVPPGSAPDPNQSPYEPTQKVSRAELLGQADDDTGSGETTEPVQSTPGTTTPLTSTPGAGPEGTEVAQSHSPADGVTRVISTAGAPGQTPPPVPPAPPASNSPQAPPGPAPSGYDSTRVISTRPPGGPVGPGGGPAGPGGPPQPGYGPPPGYAQQGHGQPAPPPGYGGPGPSGYGQPGFGQPGQPAPGPQGRPGYGPPPGYQSYGQQSHAQQAHGQSPAGDQHAVDNFHGESHADETPKTNTLAVAALVASLLGLVCIGIGGLIGLVLGLVARKQIAASGGKQTGDGLALTAIIIGLFIIVVWVAYWLVVLLTGVESPWSYF
ncbi:DUF4190 domain-containing protein [Gordonia alkanivorans]|uniref:DUF4190 domain-containing protein n=1 Tax=Gordonia alkanivorans TaxID=84096 RepID=UPI0024B76ACA|nr:DUF4190 domain-containing protein [Gordonia alkanivorans]MDJ0028626.1 DUF4190 domain-containing protein [Gordonia alkanivorans]